MRNPRDGNRWFRSGLAPIAMAALVGLASGAAGAEEADRGLTATSTEDDAVYLSWRLQEADPAGAAFHVYRAPAEREPSAPPPESDDWRRLNERPIAQTTDYRDGDPLDRRTTYALTIASGGDERIVQTVVVDPGDSPTPYRRIELSDDRTFQKVGIADLDGDGSYDFVIKSPDSNVDPWHRYWEPSSGTYELTALRHDGEELWQYDLGWAIERGIWYSPYVVYDLDGDGRAEVALKTGEGDPRDEEGRVTGGPEYLTLLDGATGEPVEQIDWIPREPFYEENDRYPYNYASRNQIGIAYLDGQTPHLIVERGTYNLIIVVAYRFDGDGLEEVWRWDNRELDRRYWGQGAHWMHSADVDQDGRDEVVIGSAVIDDDGEPLWSTGLGHPDHAYVGDIDPEREGLEIYYGIETRLEEGLGMSLVAAESGEILWGYDGFTRHVHSRGMCSDIDPRYPGSESYSADTDEEKGPAWARLWSAKGEVLSEELKWDFGPYTVYWDADPQREILWEGEISSYRGDEHSTQIEGSIAAIADIAGDWREEVITSVPGELRVYRTSIPASDRRPSLMSDPIYRLDVAHAAMGYFQVPMLSYDLASSRFAEIPNSKFQIPNSKEIMREVSRLPLQPVTAPKALTN